MGKSIIFDGGGGYVNICEGAKNAGFHLPSGDGGYFQRMFLLPPKDATCDAQTRNPGTREKNSSHPPSSWFRAPRSTDPPSYSPC